MPEVARLAVVLTGDTSDLTSKLAGAEKDVQGFAKSSSTAMMGLATGLLAGTAAVAAGLGASVTAAAGFEKTMSGVKAVSGATADEMAGLSKLALQLGKDTVFSASDAAAGIEELVKGGLSVQDIMSGAAKSTLDLATAGGIALPDAAIIAANALAQFNLKGKDMAHVADLIAGAANASALDVNQFKFSLQAAGAVASTVGFTFDDLATGIAVMGKAGIVGQDAGTSLKTMMLNLNPATGKAAKLMKELGIITADGANQFFDATGKVKSMAQVAGILQRATQKLTEEQRLEALQTLFGTDAIRAAAIMAKAGEAGFTDMAAAMGKVTAAGVAAERLNNLAGDLEQLKGSVETLAIAFGTALLPMLREAVQWATGVVNSLMPLAEQVGPALVGIFGQIGAAFAEIGRAWATGEGGAITAAFKAWSGIDLGPVIQMIYLFGERVRAVAAVFREQGLLAAIGEWVSGLPRMALLLLANLAQLLGQVLGWLVNTALPQIVARLLAWGQAFVDWATAAIGPALQALGSYITAVWGWIAAQAPAVLAQLGAWGRAFLDWAIPLVAAVPGQLAAVAEAVWAWIGANYRPILDQLGRWKDAFLDWIGPALAALPAALGPLKDGIVAWIHDVAMPAIQHAWEEFRTVSWPTIVASLEDARTRLQPVWADITKYFEDFEPTGLRIERLLHTIATVINQDLRPALEWLAGWMQVQGAEGGTFWKRFADNINQTTQRWEAMIDVIGRAIKFYTDFLDYTDAVARRLGVPVIALPNPPKTVGPMAGGVTTVPMRDAGGYGRAGQPYLIGTGAQPELFTPSSAGTFSPAGGYGSGAVPLVATISIDGMQFATVSTMARQRYADRGGRPPPSWAP